MMRPSGGSNPSNPSTLETAIHSHPFLAGLVPKYLSTLRENAMLTRFEKGTLLFREGDPANRFYLILSGQVLLGSTQRDAGTTWIQQIGAGEVLGWSWLFPPYYWHFDAQAAEPTEAIFFYGTRLREQCEQDHELGYELLKRMTLIVIQRLQSARNQLLQSRLA